MNFKFCEHCKEHFRVQSRLQRFCSPLCRKTYENLKQNEKWLIEKKPRKVRPEDRFTISKFKVADGI